MTSRNPKSNVENGFTLLEVVVALAIVGLGVVTLLEIFSLGLRLGARSSERSEAVAYAAQVMEEALIRRQLGEGTEQGFAGQRHRWRLEVKAPRLEDETALSSKWELKEIALALRYRDAGGERLVEMKTLRLTKKTGP